MCERKTPKRLHLKRRCIFTNRIVGKFNYKPTNRWNGKKRCCNSRCGRGILKTPMTDHVVVKLSGEAVEIMIKVNSGFKE